MKNNLKLFLILAVSAIVLSGCTSPNTVPSASPQTQNGFNLKEALTQGKSLKCTLTTEQGTMTSWIKDKKVRVEGTMFQAESGGNGGMINDGTSVYMWNDQNKQGTKFDINTLPSPQAGSAPNQNSEQYKNVEKWAADAQAKYKVDCKEETISDSQFVPPTDITFQDMSKILDNVKDIQKNIPSFNPGQIPSIMPLPQGVQE